jgi:inner membrane protein
MASIGHIAVGMAAARIHRPASERRWPAAAWWSALSMLPDADVAGFALGVAYGDPWGHRGATHSLTFALAGAAVVAAVAPRFRLPAARTGLIAAVVLVSHGLLDTLTNGGLGCALFWPFDLTRYFAPWRPIPVAPIGLYFFSPYGLFVSVIELVLFAPAIAFSLKPPLLKRASFVAFWAAGVWLIGSTDPVRQKVLGTVMREQTEYAAGFSEQAFRTVAAGDAESRVRELLGAPFGELRGYQSDDHGLCPLVLFELDRVSPDNRFDACSERGLRGGMSRADVERALGPARTVCWPYSRPRVHGAYRSRMVCFTDGRVAELFAAWDAR